MGRSDEGSVLCALGVRPSSGAAITDHADVPDDMPRSLRPRTGALR